MLYHIYTLRLDKGKPAERLGRKAVGLQLMKYLVKDYLSRIRADQEKGQTLIEYALIILLVSIVVMVVLAALGVEVTGVFQEIIDTFSPPA